MPKSLEEMADSISAKTIPWHLARRPSLRRGAVRAILESRATLIGLAGCAALTAFLVLLRALDVDTLLLGRDPTAASGTEPWVGALSRPTYARYSIGCSQTYHLATAAPARAASSQTACSASD